MLSKFIKIILLILSPCPFLQKFPSFLFSCPSFLPIPRIQHSGLRRITHPSDKISACDAQNTHSQKNPRSVKP